MPARRVSMDETQFESHPRLAHRPSLVRSQPRRRAARARDLLSNPIRTQMAMVALAPVPLRACVDDDIATDTPPQRPPSTDAAFGVETGIPQHVEQGSPLAC